MTGEELNTILFAASAAASVAPSAVVVLQILEFSPAKLTHTPENGHEKNRLTNFKVL